MNGKKTISWLILFTLALSAFSRPPVPPPDPNAKMIFQFLAEIKQDGSAEFHYIVKYSKEQVEENLKSEKYAEDEMCAETTSDIEKNIGAFTQEKHGEEIWCTYSLEMDTLQGLSNHLKNDFSLTVQRLEIEDGKFNLDLSWNKFPCTTSNPADFTCEFSIHAPGEVGENNATRVEGGTLTWDMMASGTPLRFEAESAVGGFDSTVLIVLAILMCGCCTVILLIAGGAAVFFFLRRGKETPVESDPGEAINPPPQAAPLPAQPPSQG